MLPRPIPIPAKVRKEARSSSRKSGCALCHTAQMRAAPVMNTAVLQDRPVNLYSDLLVHHMGSELADEIIQGQAGPDDQAFEHAKAW